MKMDPTVSSETSAIRTQTPGNYPKKKTLHLEHGGSLKTRRGESFSKKSGVKLLYGTDKSYSENGIIILTI